MKTFIKSLKIAAGILLIAPIALAANLALRTGPVDVSEIRSVLNQLTLDINNGTSGDIYANSTVVNTTAVTTEEVLYSYSLPANFLATFGDSVKVQCSAQGGATANNKTLRLYFGASVITTGAVAANNSGLFLEATVMRGATAASQVFVGRGVAGAAGITPVAVTNTAGTDNLAAEVLIRCTGQNAVAAAADVSGKMMLVESVK